LDLLVCVLAKFFVFKELHYICNCPHFSHLVHFHLRRTQVFGHLGGVTEGARLDHLGPPSPESLDLVGHGVVEVLLDGLSEVCFALGPDFVHDPA